MLSNQLSAYRQTATQINIAGHEMSYWLSNIDATTNILFVHGFPSASCDWHHQWQYFAGRANLLAMDLLGFGLSAKPAPYRYTLVEQAKLITELVKRVGWESCHIVAHDYGDSVAQEILFLHFSGELSWQIDSISFLNGGLFSEAHRPLKVQKWLKSRLGPVLVNFMTEKSLHKSFHKIFGPNTPPTKEDFSIIWHLLNESNGLKVVPALLQYIDERANRREDWLQAMQKSGVPMQFINGRLDPISGEHMATRLNELIPEIETNLLDVGHYPQLEAPEQCNQLINQFIFCDKK